VSAGPIYPLAGVVPRVAEGVFVAPTAAVIGDVELAEGSSVWFGAVLRGDVGAIRIGPRTNVQDLACIHVTGRMTPTTVGADVTIRHGPLPPRSPGDARGRIRLVATGPDAAGEDGCLIGMGSIVLDGAVIGAKSVIAAGAVVSPRTIVPPGSFVAGMPAKVVRPATELQQMMGLAGAEAYAVASRVFLAEAWARAGSSDRSDGSPHGEGER